jgi:ribosome-binding factor A
MPKEYPRSARIGAQLQQELSDLLRSNLLRDPRVYGIDLTITAVDLAQDLSQARILISSFKEGAPLKEAVEALNHAAGKLRGELGRRLRIRYIPELFFRIDETIGEADKINRLLRQALNEDRQSAADRGEKS